MRIYIIRIGYLTIKKLQLVSSL